MNRSTAWVAGFETASCLHRVIKKNTTVNEPVMYWPHLQLGQQYSHRNQGVKAESSYAGWQRAAELGASGNELTQSAARELAGKLSARIGVEVD